MGRGGEDGAVPVVRLRRSPYSVPLARFRAPGGGFTRDPGHKVLLGHNERGEHKYSAPVRKGGCGGVQRPMPKGPENCNPSNRNGAIGTRGKRGRSNVGASNRRSTNMPMEVLNATGQAALNVNALVGTEGTYHHSEMQAHLPGRPTVQPDTTKGLEIMASKIVQRELLGPPGDGPLLASESNLGDIPVDMSVDNPEPTSGRGRVSENREKTAGAEAVRDGNPLVKFVPQIHEAEEKQSKVMADISSADMFAGSTVARAPKQKVRAKPFIPKKDSIKIKPRKYGHQPESRFALDNVRVIPGLRGQPWGVPGLRFMPVDVLTEKKQPATTKIDVEQSGRQTLQKIAEWAEAKSGGNVAKVCCSANFSLRTLTEWHCRYFGYLTKITTALCQSKNSKKGWTQS